MNKGYIIPGRDDLFIYGYAGMYVLVQFTVPGIPKKLKLYHDKRGYNFRVNQEPIYLPNEESVANAIGSSLLGQNYREE